MTNSIEEQKTSYWLCQKDCEKYLICASARWLKRSGHYDPKLCQELTKEEFDIIDEDSIKK